MTLSFGSAYVTSTGAFLPGPAIDNAHMDAFIAPFDERCERIKHHILSENGIRTRHYAIDEQGHARFSAAHMASEAVRACLAGSDHIALNDIEVLCTGSTGGDLAVPGFANFFEAHAFTGRGVMQSYAVGQAVAERIDTGRYGAIDLSPLDRTRFTDPKRWVTEALHI